MLAGSNTRSTRQGEQQAELHSWGAPKLQPGQHTNQLYKTQGSFCFSETTDFRSYLFFLFLLLSKPYCSGSLHLSSLS